MRKMIPLLLVGFLYAIPASAQQATLTVPVTPPTENNYRVESSYLTRDDGGRWEVTLSVRDSGGTELRRIRYAGPDASHPAATAAAFNTAASFTIRGGETGTDVRKANFRILGFLADQGYLPAATLVP